jgi:biopolymer transport protein ExbB/TolQ
MRTILIWYQSGGPFMVPLLVVGACGVAVLLERFRFIVLRSRINARPFIERVLSLVRAGKLDEALKLCAEHQSTLPDLGLVILRSRIRDEGALLNVAEASSLSVVPAILRRLSWLPTLAIVAVLLGVLGAVANLHDALAKIAAGLSVAGTPNNVALSAAALAYALRPLGAGVLTAIPLVLGYTYLTNEAENIVGLLREFSARLVNALIDRPDVRLGHR